ncbi:hypothetical protein ACLB1G_07235 [Oxalobacteraceae bacterium A2-2]
METGLTLSRISVDDDYDQFEISITSECGCFRLFCYLTVKAILSFTDQLERYSFATDGDSLVLELGNLQAGYAGGGVRLVLNRKKNAKVVISVHGVAEMFQADGQILRPECRFYLQTEPVLIDNFVSHLRILLQRETDVACLETVSLERA